MKRFNLLLISPDVSLTQAAFRGLSKVYKNNFVFEASTREDSQRLLGKLQIDLILVDTSMGISLDELSRRYPQAMVMGITQGAAAAQEYSAHRCLPKHDLATALANELKSRRKAGEIATRIAPQPSAATPDFKDFAKLSSDLALN
jgi:hypothetical protein